MYLNRHIFVEKALNKYQVAAASVHEEPMDSMEAGSILLTDRGFSKINDAAAFG